MMAINEIHLAILDDHELFFRGLERLLNQIPEIRIVDTFLLGTALLERLDLLSIDVLLLDVQIPDMDPEQLLIQIKEARPQLPLLYLTMMRRDRIYNSPADLTSIF